MELLSIENIIIKVQGKQVILDNDVADLYGVETKRINEAVKNNPDKFPEGYILYLSMDEANSLRSKISTLKNLGRGEHFKYSPKAFSEKGLYMLATILKSPKATETTISIIAGICPAQSPSCRNNQKKNSKSQWCRKVGN